MNPRLFLGNFDFEHRLADPRYMPSEKLKRLNAELASTWLSIAEDEDWIWTPSAIDTGFIQDAAGAGLPSVIPVNSLVDVPSEVECVPWGWSADVYELAEQFGWNVNAPAFDAVRIANSRATSFELEHRWNVGLDAARRIGTVDELKNAIQSLDQSDDPWVVKAEFGMSARERILGRGPPRIADENWVRRRLTLQEALFFEPWVDRLEEVGIQIDVPRCGLPTLVGLAPMLVDDRGQYAGSWFASDDSQLQTDRVLWSEAVDVSLRAAIYLQSLGYFGPLGIDAMLYRHSDGSKRIRPLQDINARWTMGRLSLGWRRLLAPDEYGCWQHGSELPSFIHADIEPIRVFKMSPEIVGNIRCEHQSRVLIYKSENP